MAFAWKYYPKTFLQGLAYHTSMFDTIKALDGVEDESIMVLAYIEAYRNVLFFVFQQYELYLEEKLTSILGFQGPKHFARLLINWY